MKKYKFRLDTLLRLRRRQEDEEGHRLATTRKRLEVLMNEKTILENKRKDVDRQTTADLSGDVNLVRSDVSRCYAMSLGDSLKRCHVGTQEILREIERGSFRLKKAMTKRKVLENLRDRQKEVYRDTVRAHDSKTMDFSAAALWARVER